MSRIVQVIRKPYDAWDGFFHRKMDETDQAVLAFIRIGYAVLLLVNLLTWWPDLEKWFGETGVLPLAVSRKVIDSGTLTIFQWLPTTPFVLWACYLILIANVIALLFGFFSRIQALSIFVLYTSFVHRNALICDGEDILFRLMAFYLFLSPSGKCFSLETWWRSRKHHEDAPQVERKRFGIWPLRLIQIQTVAVLLFSGIEKTLGENWLDGTAMFYVSRLDDMFYRFPIPDFPFESMFMISIMTWAAVVLELSVPILIWFRKTRWLALLVAVGFHLSLEYTMNLNLFQWIMILGWCSFFRRDEFSFLLNRFGKKTS